MSKSTKSLHKSNNVTQLAQKTTVWLWIFDKKDYLSSIKG